MRKFGRHALIGAGVLLGGLFVMFVFNQTMQFVAAVERVSPVLGTVLLWMLLGLYALAIVILLWNFIRLPKPLRPPATDDGPAFVAYLNRLRSRLRGNAALNGRPLKTRAEIETALEALGEKSDDIIRDAALQAFFVTALSQNGNLDALAVITIHGRLVYDIARHYYQRPTVRDLLFLYGNVAVAALVARQMDDMDMSEYIAPISNAVTSSVIGSIPGAQGAVNVAVHAVLTGSANAYMTLRVGIIAKRYCGSVVSPGQAEVRRAAFVEAAQMFPGIVAQGTKKVVDLIGAAVVKGSKDALVAVGRGVTTVAGKTVRSAGEKARDMGRTVSSVTTAIREIAAGRAKDGEA